MTLAAPAGTKGTDVARPPKKYADKERTIVTEEWQAWHRDQLALADEMAYTQLPPGTDPSTYFPGDKLIPEEGAWILVIEVPHTALQFDVPLLSMWRARHHELNSGAVTIAKGVKAWPQQAVISTPGGDLHLWAHEYVVISDPRGLVGDPDTTLHQLGGSPVLNEDHLFYLQSRGIQHRDAVLMLFDQITDQDFIYATFPEWITSMLEGVGRSLRRHIQLNPRAAAALDDAELEDAS